MRRTYRSKKDIGGGVDHKDLISTIDAKSSVFDAFYIQNIKQTKRDISCMGSSNQSNVASYKVRKRKYVKRIVKDVSIREETPGDSASQSAYLTPDKSIHVKKALDPFDLLLRSSPAVNESPRLTQKVQEKTYGKKKPTKIKKLNFCSNDNSGIFSDKEKTQTEFSNTSQNMSDIKCHKLIIEKESVYSPNCHDESIYNIVKQMPLLTSINRSTRNRSLKNNHRLTATINLESPDISNSPLCSTPFQEKYRSKSIYNFSPISMDLTDSSEVHRNNSNKCNYSKMINFDENKENEIYEQTSKTTQSLPARKSPVKDDNCNSKSQSIKELKSNKTGDHSRSDPAQVEINKNSLFTSEIEPFHGFALTSIIKEVDNTSDIVEKQYAQTDLDKNESVSELGLSHIHGEESKDSAKVHIDNASNVLITVEDDTESNPTSHSSIIDSFDVTDKHSNEENVSVIDSSMIEDKFNETKKSNMCYKNELNRHADDNSTDENDRDSFKSQITDSASFYDTCDSNESSIDNDNAVCLPKPVVVLERMDNSIFYKYYYKMANLSIQNEDMNKNTHSSSGEHLDYLSSEENQQQQQQSTDLSNETFNRDKGDYDDSVLIFSKEERPSLDSDKDNGSNKSEEEDRCISFVTTRRRNELTNDSIIFICDNSYGTASSFDINKTVISSNENALFEKQDTNIPSKEEIIEAGMSSITEENAIRQEFEIENENIKTNTELIKIDVANVTTRNSTCKRESSEIGSEIKPPIVLQPGKKWERSLSIYKRMTTMVDSFNHSVLDDEPLKCKGRKYRQSVINTMEMQKFQNPLHNESINGRRSTFVCNPGRSTIKIVKENITSRASLCSTTVYEDLKGFLSDDCDDTIVELSKLSIGDSEHEVTVLEKFHDTSRIATARDYVLRRCNQTEAILFDECYPDTELKNCHKIGEGVYGEVFLWRAHDGRARVLKIIPIAGDIKVNGELQKGYHEIISEIVIAMELSALRAPISEIEKRLDEGKEIDALDLHSVENASDVFNEVLAVRCVCGGYPSRLLDLWDLYDECKGSENDNPAILPVDQHFIVLELANAGQDLESYQFNSAEQAHALFLQIAFGLAVAEEAFQFEHRDLHWGNVLITPTDQKYATFVLRGRTRRVLRRGVAGTVIDYSLSRLSLRGGALYSDLAADDALFDAVGDRQFTVYRLMRERLGNDWKNFEPYTNILWLDYIVDKMITSLRYKRTNTKIHKHYIAKLKAIKNRILDYGSAALFVLTDNEF